MVRKYPYLSLILNNKSFNILFLLFIWGFVPLPLLIHSAILLFDDSNGIKYHLYYFVLLLCTEKYECFDCFFFSFTLKPPTDFKKKKDKIKLICKQIVLERYLERGTLAQNMFTKTRTICLMKKLRDEKEKKKSSKGSTVEVE